MISDIFLYLIIAGLGSEIIAKDRFERFLTFILFGMLVFLGMNFFESWQAGVTDKFTYHWITSRYNKADINIFSSAENYALIFPFFIMSALLVLDNLFYPLEPKKSSFSGLIVLNLACLILLICSRNFIQLLIGACAIDVLGFYVTDDMEAKKKYTFYNTIADLGLFMVFAVLWGYLGSMEISRLSDFHKLGAHRDLIAILLIACVMIKSGMFMFQNQFLDFQGLSFNRLNMISFVSTPVVGIIILCKTYPLLEISRYSVPLIQIIAGASVFWGVCGALLIDNIKEKALYLNMMLYGTIYGLLSVGLIESTLLSELLVGGFLLVSCLMLVVISSSNENYVSRMGGFIRSLKWTFFVTLAVILAVFQVLIKNTTPENHYWMWGYAAALTLSLSYVLPQIYFGKSNADERVFAMLKNAFVSYWGPVLLIAAVWIYRQNLWNKTLYALCAAFALLLILRPLRRLGAAYDSEQIQETDFFESLYNIMLIAPIKILGRVLWLTIDFLIIEKTLINTLGKIMNFLIQAVQKINSGSVWNNIAFILLGWGIIICYFYFRG